MTDRVTYRPRSRNPRGPLHAYQEGMSRVQLYFHGTTVCYAFLLDLNQHTLVPLETSGVIR
jgi:hypothetical protein